MSGLNEGQIVGAITAGVTGIVGIYGIVANRFGTFSNRQTAIETNLLEQIKLLSTRLDNMEKEKLTSESAFRKQLDEAAQERRNIEKEFRALFAEQEKEIKELEAVNTRLLHENWLLKNNPIGIQETTPQATRPPDRLQLPTGTEEEATGET